MSYGIEQVLCRNPLCSEHINAKLIYCSASCQDAHKKNGMAKRKAFMPMSLKRAEYYIEETAIGTGNAETVHFKTNVSGDFGSITQDTAFAKTAKQDIVRTKRA